MRFSPLLLLVLLAACHGGDSPPADADTAFMDTSADSADPTASPVIAVAQPTPGFGLPHPGSWDSTRVADGGEFTLIVPNVADARWRDIDRPANRKFRVAELPECSWPCTLTVTTSQDSRKLGLTQWMHDHFRMDAPVEPTSFDLRPTQLPSVLLGADTALRLSLHCEGCTSEALVTGSKGRIAVIEYSVDSRETDRTALLGHLRAIGRTFRWSE